MILQFTVVASPASNNAPKRCAGGIANGGHPPRARYEKDPDHNGQTMHADNTDWKQGTCLCLIRVDPPLSVAKLPFSPPCCASPPAPQMDCSGAPRAVPAARAPRNMVGAPTWLTRLFARTCQFKRLPDASGWEPPPCWTGWTCAAAESPRRTHKLRSRSRGRPGAGSAT